MEKLRTSLTKTLKNLSDSLTEDACMEDMSDFVLSPHEAYSELDYNTSVLEIPKASQRPTAKIVLETEDDIINSIDASYFIEDDFDATGYELRKLFDTDLHIEDVDRECMCLKSQLQVVSKKISTLIMEKSPSYNAQIEDMDEIKDCIEELVRKIRAIRRSLLNAQSKSRAAMHILANEKKKRLLNRLLSTLRIIKTLYETEFHLKDCIEGGNFPMAIRLCLEAKEAANTYCHFSCVSDLMTKLVGFTNLIENSLDDALSTCAIVFDQDQYVLVYSAFIMLNKVELASKKLISHFITTLKNSSRKIIEDRFLESNPAVGNAELSYEELCEHINTEDLVTTVRELGYVMCKILIFYHSILRFHVEDDERRRLNNTVEDGSIGIVANQMTFSLHAVFQVALSAMHSLLCCQNFSQLNFDQLLDIVFMVNSNLCKTFRFLQSNINNAHGGCGLKS
ncbi:hypothetical protein DICVIV_01358 [Dictyocaulus viviparus]|uniref:Vacuolar protein sorting-associated protein 54 N-terminal domain-containing protein n=1 Tax=Dictyocaulus viviparus TaxID=29172 RepID=A0A0D8Y8H9_DICVI|nr:hypothetical protein DICVIV_01358 [Dictyocaulus viviparus]